MLFIDFSSACNTIIPMQLIGKLGLLGLNTSICNWILDFLTEKPQTVQIGNTSSKSITLSTGAPQGCVLSPLLFTLLTHDYETTVVGLISNNNDTYREEVEQLAGWCKDNNLLLNVTKTKEVVVDYRKTKAEHPPLSINGDMVEQVTGTKFLGVHISNNLSWSTNINSITKRAQQRLHFLRRLKKRNNRERFDHGQGCVNLWFGSCHASDRKLLQRVVRTAEKIIGTSLPCLQDLYTAQATRNAKCILGDPSHPSHGFFSPLPSGRRFRSISSKTTRMRDSFFPQAVRLMNSLPPSSLSSFLLQPSSTIKLSE
ncbi:putative RNA-directed DNA polymerase from transposon BS [Merluccius polli]|uniref:RNA-directed DNA polymerase from transposon BS n=1 Tax=Merluccius polli TaxID=89951 RepID=A0AA47P320_MERPO|nr:putative RNA-directed DNA polymerase from transposon BS [Merluccius polli]